MRVLLALSEVEAASGWSFKSALSTADQFQRASFEPEEMDFFRAHIMPNCLNILHLEDDRLDADLIRETLAVQGIVAEMHLVETEGAFRAALLNGSFDLVLSDYDLPGLDGLSALGIVRKNNPDLPFIFVSGAIGEENAVESLKSGATDYVSKQGLQRLGLSVRRALSETGEKKRSKSNGHSEGIRQALEAPLESKQSPQTVIENLSEGLIVSDLNGQLLHWNKAALEVHGLASKDECLLPLSNFHCIFELSELDGAVLEPEQWPLARIIRGELLSNVELRVRRTGQDWNRIFNYGGSIVCEATGKLVAFVTITDITERKHAEEGCRLLAAIVASSHDAIIGKTLDGFITSWNQGAKNLYGYSEEEIIGRSIAVLAPPEYFDEVASITKRLKRGETINPFETERITKKGNRISVSITISPIRTESGAISGLSTIARDITERKDAEEALKTSETRYRRLFESAQDGILILDAESGKIIDVNPFLMDMLGFSKEELAGKELWEIGAFKDIVASKAAFATLRRRGYLRYENLPLQTRDGIVRQVEFVSNSYQAAERQVIQCNIRDITERKLAEEELRLTNQRLEGALAELQAKTQELASMTQQLWQASKLATMGELAASVAHELNNPLATLALHAESLLDQFSADDPKRRAITVIDHEVERMATLVSNLLVFSRRSHPQTSTLDLGEELNNTIEFISYHLRSHKIDIVTDFAPDLPSVNADRQQLRQVFLNLLTNSSDAMPEGGTLTVRAKPYKLEKGAPAIMIEFSDDGAGIDPKDMPRLWEPFFTTKPEGRGTGLGLPICRRTVEAHRGTIEIESQLGIGTTVRIVLPATKSEV